MTEQPREDGNLQIGREISQKFEFYLIALVFTILGLSVQTSVMTSSGWQRFFELLSWGCLLLSGLSGLSRLEWLPGIYYYHGYRRAHERDAERIKQGLAGSAIIRKEDGQCMTKEELSGAKVNYEKRIETRAKDIDKINKSALWKYRIHRWCFVIGVCALLVSRAMQKLAVSHGSP